MATPDEDAPRPVSVPLIERRATLPVLLALPWLGPVVLGSGWLAGDPPKAVFFALVSVLGGGATLWIAWWGERLRWRKPIQRLADQVEALARQPSRPFHARSTRGCEKLTSALERLAEECQRLDRVSPSGSGSSGEGDSSTTAPLLTRNHFFDSTPDARANEFDPLISGEYATTDMVNRLEPRLFRWLESSLAEQAFLGWNLAQLREKSFLEIVHPDDLARAREGFRLALVKGEVHDLALRIRTAHGKHRVITINAGARYGSDRVVSHLRCHVADITVKVRAERERRLRTRELTQVNEQLRLINRELEELKERYRDLYENAPTMYFSLDNAGRILECNETLVRTLGYRRGEVIGRRYDFLLPEAQRGMFEKRFGEFLQAGTIEVFSRWVKADGEVIDVWVKGTAVRDASGRIVHSRSVAQDVSARVQLEAELNEKNERLARTIEELSRRNREMDEFTYVVSHDLQEPIRTLNAFSDFLLADYGDRLDAGGREFVENIVDASRRMRTLILDLMALSRAGKVTAEFATVDLAEVLAVVRADLKELIRSKHAELNLAGPLPEVWGDRSRLGQLLANLVANGLKYNASPGPVVEIGALARTDTTDKEPTEDGAEGEPRVTLYVRDNGIGIEPRFHSKIFQLFKRLHARDEYEGNGAGLAICTKIVQAHGGRIWVDSRPGAGATFFVSLPSRPPLSINEPPDKPAGAGIRAL